MKILLINHYAGSPDMGMEFRPYYMAREWVKAGHEVHIYAASYSHLRKKNPDVTVDFQEQEIDGINYHWVCTREYDGNGVKRAITMFQFITKLYLNARKIVKKCEPDVIITSSTYPLDTFVGQRIRRVSGNAKLIHEIHDMWPISPIELGNMSKYNPFIIAMQIGENSFCKKSDRIVSLLPYAKDYLVEHGMKPEKFVTISNGIVLEEWEHQEEIPEEHQELFDRLKGERKLIIGFFGSHTKSYALEYLIDAVGTLNDDNICAVFVGSGMDKENLIAYAQKYKDKVFFLPPVNKMSIPKLLERMDLIYVGAVNNRMFRFGICMNKLFDSMMSGKPILYAVNAPNNYIEDYSCGISVEPENTDALVRGIEQFRRMDISEREEMGRNGHQAVLEHLEYSVLANEFLKIMK